MVPNHPKQPVGCLRPQFRRNRVNSLIMQLADSDLRVANRIPGVCDDCVHNFAGHPGHCVGGAEVQIPQEEGVTPHVVHPLIIIFLQRSKQNYYYPLFIFL